jgi:hypothetical protein
LRQDSWLVDRFPTDVMAIISDFLVPSQVARLDAVQ